MITALTHSARSPSDRWQALRVADAAHARWLASGRTDTQAAEEARGAYQHHFETSTHAMDREFAALGEARRDPANASLCAQIHLADRLANAHAQAWRECVHILTEGLKTTLPKRQ